jgi:D-glycero-D-manno-heptose 1,7-bisphosphate phosphatase
VRLLTTLTRGLRFIKVGCLAARQYNGFVNKDSALAMTCEVTAMQHAARRFVALDRDGTLIVERHYPSDPEQVELIPGAAEGLRRLRALGLGVIVVTNQSGIERGYLDEPQLNLVHARLRELLAAEGTGLDGIFVCPHAPERGCRCRKPLPGLLEQASRELQFDARQCFVVGDKPCDIELGRGVGATTFLVRTGYGAEYADWGAKNADHVVDDIAEAARVIEAHHLPSRA